MNGFRTLATALILLNVADAVFTQYLVVEQGAEELNPLMSWLIEAAPDAWITYKIIWVTSLVLGIGHFYKHCKTRATQYYIETGLTLSIYCYILLFGYHLLLMKGFH